MFYGDSTNLLVFVPHFLSTLLALSQGLSQIPAGKISPLPLHQSGTCICQKLAELSADESPLISEC